jgi:serine/threonine-protein kinase
MLVLGDVSRARSYAHGRGVVHRDIKPEKVMLSGGAALVTDFGLAKAMSSARSTSTSATDSLTRMGTTIGTPS